MRPRPRRPSRNAIADLLLGYPASGSIPINPEIDDYVNYFSGYIQDDYRVTNRLTVNYGIRLEHETGLAERTISSPSASIRPRPAR